MFVNEAPTTDHTESDQLVIYTNKRESGNVFSAIKPLYLANVTFVFVKVFVRFVHRIPLYPRA